MHLLVYCTSVNTIPRFAWMYRRRIKKYIVRNNRCLKPKPQMKERNAAHSVVDVFTAYLEMKAAQYKFETQLLK